MADRYQIYILKRVDNPRVVDMLYVPYKLSEANHRTHGANTAPGKLWVSIRKSYADILGEDWNKFLLTDYARLERYKEMYGIK